MLEKLLQLIEQGGSLTPVTLARQLNTTPGMVEMMMDELTRRGLLKATEFSKNCDSESCGACYLANTCHQNRQKIWMTTNKSQPTDKK